MSASKEEIPEEPMSWTSHVIHPPHTPLDDEDNDADSRLIRQRRPKTERYLALANNLANEAELAASERWFGSEQVQTNPQGRQQKWWNIYSELLQVISLLTANDTWYNPENIPPKERSGSSEKLQAKLLHDAKEVFEDHKATVGYPYTFEQLLKDPELKRRLNERWHEFFVNRGAIHLGLDISQVEDIQVHQQGRDETLTIASADCTATAQEEEACSEAETESSRVSTRGRLTWRNTRRQWSFAFEGSEDIDTLDRKRHFPSITADAEPDASLGGATEDALPAHAGKGKGKAA